VGWDEVAGGGEALWSRVQPAGSALAGWPTVSLEAKAVTGFRNGQMVPLASSPAEGGRVRVHDRLGTFLGVGELGTGGRTVRPVRILHADRPGTRVLPA
jgi:tRNA U55 pseudouridine synthase TruB